MYSGRDEPPLEDLAESDRSSQQSSVHKATTRVDTDQLVQPSRPRTKGVRRSSSAVGVSVGTRSSQARMAASSRSNATTFDQQAPRVWLTATKECVLDRRVPESFH